MFHRHTVKYSVGIVLWLILSVACKSDTKLDTPMDNGVESPEEQRLLDNAVELEYGQPLYFEVPQRDDEIVVLIPLRSHDHELDPVFMIHVRGEIERKMRQIPTEVGERRWLRTIEDGRDMRNIPRHPPHQ